jgi:hypothetical protein
MGVLRGVNAADLGSGRCYLQLQVSKMQLTCGQLNDSVPINPKNTFTQRITPPGADSYVKLDNAAETLSVLFVKPPGRHLHVVMQFTPVGESKSKHSGSLAPPC